jgi:hypothetical protein
MTIFIVGHAVGVAASRQDGTDLFDGLPVVVCADDRAGGRS